MSQWKNTDNAANSVSWAARSIGAGSGKAAQAANNTALFDNTTSSAFITNLTIGQFGITTDEQQASLGKITHAGYVMIRTGSGGRAGRTTYETLVAMGSMTGDADSNTIPNYTLLYTAQPVSASGNSTNNDVVNFSAKVSSVPSGASITYAWYANTGSGYSALTNGGAYGNVATANLAVLANAATTGTQFKLLVSAAGAVNTYSSVATLTITS